MALTLILVALACMAVSAMPAYVLPRRGPWGDRGTALLAGLGMVTGLAGLGLHAGHEPASAFAGTLALDTLALPFLGLVFLIGGLGSLHAVGYWPTRRYRRTGARVRLAYGLMIAAMGVVVLARHAWVFLTAWEAMAIAGFILIVTEDQHAAVRKAGWLYLVTSQLGTAALVALAVVWRSASGTWAFGAIAPDAAIAAATPLMLALGFFGFGMKAGLVPLHFWLPPAHAAAPSHVSALLSGVMIKMGIYGLARLVLWFPDAPWGWSAVLIFSGAASAFIGALGAFAASDVKRVLANSTIDNAGIIVVGLGTAALGLEHGQSKWLILGLGGALMHVVAHGVFKALLFLAAGGIVHATRTRNLALLGGLHRRMPVVSLVFLIGCLALAALPPLGSFVSELCIYRVLFVVLAMPPGAELGWVPLVAGVLAMAGALALATAVKLYGIAFLGAPRSQRAAEAHPPGRAIVAPLVVLAGIALLQGLGLPLVVTRFVRQLIGEVDPTGAGRLQSEALETILTTPLLRLTVCMAVIAVVVVAGRALLGFVLARRPGAQAATWGCGYLAPTARMQYSSDGLAGPILALFGQALALRRHPLPPDRAFPAPITGALQARDFVLDRAVRPAWRLVTRGLDRLHFLQQGRVQYYVLYILIAALVLMTYGLAGDHGGDR